MSGGPGWAYLTSVLPGGGLQFASARVGFALTGAPTDGIDQNLSSPAGIDIAWPSRSVLVSRNGGRRWTQALSAPGGFWGIDVLDANRVWAIGANRMYRTVDGGVRWQPIAETRSPLVRVAFTSPHAGLGLTAAGRLMQTSNGGGSWHTNGWGGRADALCDTAHGTAVLAAENGGVWRSANAGQRWRRVAPGFAHVVYESAWYPDLSCHGSDAVEFAQAFCQAACGGTIVSRVRQSSDEGSIWRTILRQATGFGRVATNPMTGPRLPLDRASATGGDGVCLAGSQTAPARLQIECRVTAASGFQAGGLPRLPFKAGRSSITVQGLDFLNRERGWVLLDQYTAARTPQQSDAKTEVWSTTDRGENWSLVSASSTYHGAWCSRLHDVCWQSPTSMAPSG